MSKKAMKLALETLEVWKGYMPALWDKTDDQAITALREALAEQPAQQEPVAFPTRRAVEREIERTANPTGMHLNDGKERVALPGGTLRHMLALIDRTSPPAQRTWVGLAKSEITTSLPYSITRDKGCFHAGALWAEAKLKAKNSL